MLHPYVEGSMRRRRFKCVAHRVEDFRPNIQGTTIVNLVIAGEEQGSMQTMNQATKSMITMITKEFF